MPSTRAYKTGAIISGATTDGTTIVADSAATTGLRWQAGKVTNGIINGGFDIWQRGTSLTGTGQVRTADRWWLYRDNGVSGCTISRQTSGLAGTQYCARIQRDSGNTSTAYIRLYQDIETNESLRFIGQTVTFSFYARKGANYSGGNLDFYLNTGTGTDQNQYTGFTNFSTALTVTATAASMSTSTWTRYQGTVTLSSSVTQLGIYCQFTPTGTAGAADFIELSGVQLELGSAATVFNRAGGTLQGELAACQRYYTFDDSGTRVWIGNCTSGSTYGNEVYLPVTMRVAPTITQTHSVSNGFPGGSPTSTRISTKKFYSEKTSDGTTTAGYFQMTWTASAEL